MMNEAMVASPRSGSSMYYIGIPIHAAVSAVAPSVGLAGGLERSGAVRTTGSELRFSIRVVGPAAHRYKI